METAIERRNPTGGQPAGLQDTANERVLNVSHPVSECKIKALQPIKHQPVWDEYDSWPWEKQADWAMKNHRSDSQRRIYIEEQLEVAKESRIAKGLATEIADALEPRLRALVKDVLLEVASGAIHR